ncbi:carboxypeptidase M32 [Roseicyclus mahoneyensis]|uniref:Metal-dependent carboxypeptidase n=1 Tax=Roseicyclus mahoneyensis TaxID=164332 RepID=A0A316GRK8_9RHOB|nr:carboxypeptidase M32 [Roseicyclus mahoneyensis]PWK62672.1 carboxypeptidase Taq [Roseicyclus mahoneyensis]
MRALDDLLAFQRETEALAQVMGRLGWDQETVMPRGAAVQRGDEMAALEGVLHARRTDPRIGDWLAGAQATTQAEAAQLRLIARSFERARKIPARLAAEIARVTSVAQGQWAQARRAEDLTGFLPVLGQVVALRREEGAALAEGGDAYDALLDGYEPGITGAEIGALFDRMRPRLVALRAAVMAADPAPELTGHFPKITQLALTEEIARAFGYDLTRGRIDEAVHPFSSGSFNDVRITTRVDEGDPLGCLYSTVHEVGHAGYEQNIDQSYGLTALGQGVSMGVHESQSRIYENQLGRSPAFCQWLYARMVDRFGPLSVDGPEAFARAVNRVASGFIRTEADEVHYNLHIMLRFDLERDLMRGDLVLDDLEAAWNDRFLSDFGVTVDRPSHGMLQDVHWPVGLFGYFPTYTLGNVYAGCLHAALRADLPSLDDDLARGDVSGALCWLKTRVQTHGGLRLPRETIEHATGGPVSEAPLLDYLEAKFGALYGL